LDLCNTYCTARGYDGSHPVGPMQYILYCSWLRWIASSCVLFYRDRLSFTLLFSATSLLQEILNQFIYSDVDNKTLDRAIST
jgi:hypothetical protein